MTNASDLGWLIDAAQHELSLLEAVAKGEPEQDSLQASPLRQQVNFAKQEMSARPSRPSDLQDQVMIRRARALEIELAEMAAGDRELARMQVGLLDCDRRAPDTLGARLRRQI